MKIAIIGTGFVGSSAAYAVALSGSASEIVLIDVNSKLAEAQAEDISHAVPFSTAVRIAAGSYADLKNARVLVLCCGVNQKPGENRMQLLERNVKIFRSVLENVMPVIASNTILLVASNPVDVMTYVTQKITGLSPTHVFGSGTILDTARFKTLIGNHVDVSPLSIHAGVLGEHGDSEVLAWSNATVGSLALETFAEQAKKPLTPKVKASIDEGVRRAAYRIIEGKGATYYGIGAGLARVVKAIRNHEQSVFTLSTADPEKAGVCYSLPRLVGAHGITQTLTPTLSAEEASLLEKSVEVLAEISTKVPLKK